MPTAAASLPEGAATAAAAAAAPSTLLGRLLDASDVEGGFLADLERAVRALQYV
jgi:hypothetical protein